MLNGALAHRYAQALFELALEMSVLDQIEKELLELAETVNQNNDLKILLNHPDIEAETKKQVLASIFGNTVSDMTRHFVYLLIDRRRQNLLSIVQREFTRLANEARNIIEAKVISATALSPAQEEKLKETIAKTTGKNVRLLSEVNPTLIGGAKLQVGDRVMDGSITTALSKIREELKKTSSKPQQEVGVN
ncbi:F0F1 ATP synthase subunit delta [Dehalobacter sp. DCM]|uniref:F0F1 ATP synthase subunit delta n=1 Tax=Dehalobacter sp. DCM TaxID=2907827 RepID=UPI00308131BE|nr:F0F1 ATP synthase subunit delta [Dehalobacter sp. DCM]